jgi:3-isopropylmalate dehydratase small subunit
MQKFTSVTSNVVPVPIRDVDTDMIIPADFLKGVTREGYGENVFKRLREQDENFPFNQARYQGAKILVADDNFGCGSSREHAVWALADWGIRAIISTSFADIFAGNCGKNGVVLVELEKEVVENLLERATVEDLKVTVDLANQLVELADGEKHSFEYDGFRKHCIISGLDDIDYIRTHKEAIDSFRERQAETTFFNSTEANR